MKKGVIFDMDGVLIDSEEYYFNRRMEYFKRIKIKPNHTNLQSFIGKSNDAVWKLLIKDSKIRSKIKADYEASISNDKTNYKKLLIPGVRDFLELLTSRQIKIALASAGDRDRNIKVLYDCELYEYFDVVLGAEDVERNKPDPQIYIKAVKQLNLLSEECLVIEDSFNGIMAAKEANIETWALKPRKHEMNQKKADEIFLNFKSISETFFKGNYI